MFAKGQEIVCVRDDWNDPVDFVHPKRGQHYHCDGYAPEDRPSNLAPYIYLVGFQRVMPYGRPAYSASFFRAIEKRKTDISVFTGLLTPTKVKEDA